ncbi:MAG: gliding motility protein GldM [Flavobacterium sp.]|nr:gliding motility protein GldM [Flavobacterium sp.]
MSLPKEPRQKMINVMYLVLTALLALNVSSEILNAFKTVNESLINSNKSIDEKNQTIFNSFKQELNQAEKKQIASIWLPKAEQAQKLADDMIQYLAGLQLTLKQDSKLEMVDGKEKYNEDNLDAATRLFVEPGKAKGEELRQKLTEFKTKILAIDTAIFNEFSTTLPLNLSIPQSSDNKIGKDDWAFSYFHMTPTIAAITILSKFQNDVKNSEAQIVEFCHKKVGEVQIRYDAFQALVGQNAEYLMPGAELRITGGVGAYSKASLPTVTIDGAIVPLNAEGVAEYKASAGNPGTYSKKVRVSFKDQNGKVQVLEKEVKYTVGSPTDITVSADAVKVLYIGVANPISITGGAKGAESITATIDNGSISDKGNGKYEANVETPGKATISVSSDGKTTPFNFKVKRIPSPQPMVGQSAGGSISVNTFKAQVGVRAELIDFVFQGIKYDVTSFLLVAQGKGFQSGEFAQNRGAYFTPEAKAIIEKCKAGSTVVLQDIIVSGPDGSRKLDGVVAFNLTP